MSTRGAFGWIYNGLSKIGYISCDAYPENGSGDCILKILKQNKFNSIEKLINFFNSIELLMDYDEKYDDSLNRQKKKFEKRFWDNEKFLYNSLFCEFAYIINIDTKMLEFYVGINKDQNTPGRYAKFESKGLFYDEGDARFYGVKLFKEISLYDCFLNDDVTFK